MQSPIGVLPCIYDCYALLDVAPPPPPLGQIRQFLSLYQCEWKHFNQDLSYLEGHSPLSHIDNGDKKRKQTVLQKLD